MRIYTTFPEALNEIKRNVAELGLNVHPQTMQDKQIADDPDFATREIQNEIYTVSQPRLSDLNPSQPWADAEFEERINFVKPEEGQAWKLRPEVWQEFHDRGFGYSYGERYSHSLLAIIAELKTHPDSRQLFLAVWDQVVDPDRFGRIRVPCSLGYQFLLRQGKLHLTYLQRSADVITHFENDVYLSHKLQVYVAKEIGVQVGRYTHWIGSLHAYKKDVAGVF